MFFTVGERAVFKNFASWGDDDAEEGWYTLPVLAEWWSDHYDYDQHGFDMSPTTTGQFEAYQLIHTIHDELPAIWDRVFPSKTELCLVRDSVEGKMLLELFR